MEEAATPFSDRTPLLAVGQSEVDGFHQAEDGQVNKSRTFGFQLKLLMTKNLLVQKRSLKSLFMQLFAPIGICLIIYILQLSANSVVGQSVKDPPIISIDKVPRCVGGGDPTNCSSLTYAVVGKSEPWIHSVIDYVAKDNNLTRQNDVQYLGEIQPVHFQDHLKNNSNYTQIGVIFCNSEWPVKDDIVIPCQFARNTSKKLVFYSIVYNATEIFYSIYAKNDQSPQPTHPIATSLKISVDNAIFSYFSIDKLGKGDQELVLDPQDPNAPKMRNLDKQEYPRSFSRFFIGIDVVTMTGALQFFVPYMINFIFTVINIVREKDKRLRQGLAVMGMSHGSYWASWVLTSMAINFCITVLTVGMGLAFGYQFFTDTSIPITFFLFFFFGQALQTLAFWITTLCSSSNSAYTVAFSVLLVSVVLQSFLTTSYVSFLFFLRDSPVWFLPIRYIFQLFPSYNFAVVFGQITLRSGRHYDLGDNYWKQGPGFTYRDLLRNNSGSLASLRFNVPPPIIFFMSFIADIILYCVLTWYCDNIVPHNQGTAKEIFFCLKRNIQKKTNHILKKTGQDQGPGRQSLEDSTSKSLNFNSPQIPESVRNEKDRVIRKVQNNPHSSNGLRIVGLTKSYNYSLKKSQNVYALNSLYLGINKGELLGLLGPNGAGKTTLIGVLTGLLSPTSGTAILNGYDITQDIDKAREVIGVCPQFDILWDELTAEEHLYMFAKLKGIPEERIQEEIDERLNEINLMDMKKVITRAFSGGMKRRLSIAIALIGDPKIIFLDEPTTGMDPKNRQYIWQMIQKMKKGRAVMLTTHAMEEADALSDRIAIIMRGQLRCIGTPLFLKNEYGDGYRLSLIVDKDDINGAVAFIKKNIPSGKIIDCSGGSVLVGIPLEKKSEMQSFIKIIEDERDTSEKREFKKRIKDWGLRHSTLEEVFMKVSKQNRQQQAQN